MTHYITHNKIKVEPRLLCPRKISISIHVPTSTFRSMSISQTTYKLRGCGQIQGFLSLVIVIFQMYSKDGNVFLKFPVKFLHGLQCLRSAFVQSWHNCTECSDRILRHFSLPFVPLPSPSEKR